MIKRKTSPIIKRFKICELFGVYNVDIPFNDDFNIFIGENGLGKTTILNCINYVLQCDSDNLANIDFKKIEVYVGEKDIIEINHDELVTENMIYSELKSANMINDFSSEETYSKKLMGLIRRLYINNREKAKDIETQKSFIFRDLRFHYGFEVSKQYFEKIFDDIVSGKINNWENRVQEVISDNVIYLPTYRRIEEDFKKYLAFSNSSYSENRKAPKDIINKFSNMQFGMDDVSDQINFICNELKTKTSEGFKEMTTNLLSNYVKIMNSSEVVTQHKINKKIDATKLDIIFSRLADKIDDNVKDTITSVVLDKRNITKKNKNEAYLITIINSLINIYENNKMIDDNIENFQSVCNQYLVNNYISFNKFKIECTVLQKVNNKKIELKDLSSGEKQIISLFSKLYLTGKTNNIILFDEPELSLSILWQEKLIPDIVKSKRCSFLIAVTHSPFIFDNEYIDKAVDIRKYIKPSNEIETIEK